MTLLPVRNGLQLLFAVFGIVLLGGCVHIERYPKSWESVPVGAATDCTAVTVTYANEGENVNGNRILLAPSIEPRQYKSTVERAAYESDLTKAQTVQLQLTANLMTVVASGEHLHREWSFDSNRREFECKHGVIRIRHFEVANDIVFGVSKWSDYLYRVGDHLIVRSPGVAVGLALIVPFAVVGTSWARFPVVPSRSGTDGTP